MKKTLLWVASILAFSSVSALAEGPYVAGNLGLGIYHDSDISDSNNSSNNASAAYDMGYGVDVAVGYSFNQNFRVEAEFGYKTTDVDKIEENGVSFTLDTFDVTATTSVMSYMLNGYYDFTQANLPIVPYVGLGLGFVSGEMEYSEPGYSETKDDSTFGYQVMLGISFPVNKNFSVNAGYKYQGAASDFEKDDTKISYSSSSFLLGARYNF
jgi:opacity protein-like surface antigen